MSFLGDIFLLKLASDYNLIDNEAIMKKKLLCFLCLYTLVNTHQQIQWFSAILSKGHLKTVPS